MKTFYLIQVIDSRFQTDYVTPKKNRFFEVYETAPEHTNLNDVLLKQKEVKMVSDGKRFNRNELI